MPNITVGILTRDRKEMALRAIASCYTQGIKDLEVVVVVVNSQDGTYEAVREKFPQVKLIRIPRNLGCPGGRNHVYANSSGDYIVNLDDDGYLGKGALKRVVEVFKSDPGIGIIALRQCYPGEPIPDRNDKKSLIEVGHFLGGVSAFRRRMLDEIGYYPEDFFFFKEEEFLDLKAIDAGYKIIFDPTILMWHPRTQETVSIDTRRDYYRYRNPLLVVIRLFPGRYLWQYLIARIISYGLVSLRRKSVRQYFQAVAAALMTLPTALSKRHPCRPETVRKYLSLREEGQIKELFYGQD